ncbi:integrase catalytic domain-containing protein [Trichonephila clavipes]|nr:integrase catalytic domain-containing protein [Trichonephila clavipes]
MRKAAVWGVLPWVENHPSLSDCRSIAEKDSNAILNTAVKEDLEFDESLPVYYSYDLSNALYWIKKNEYWVVYVYNRIQEIRKLTNSAEWRHISGFLNPADLSSRGCKIENLSRSRWWEGPQWLKLPSTDWPQI